jgi:hypothetical protein
MPATHGTNGGSKWTWTFLAALASRYMNVVVHMSINASQFTKELVFPNQKFISETITNLPSVTSTIDLFFTLKNVF